MLQKWTDPGTVPALFTTHHILPRTFPRFSQSCSLCSRPKFLVGYGGLEDGRRKMKRGRLLCDGCVGQRIPFHHTLNTVLTPFHFHNKGLSYMFVSYNWFSTMCVICIVKRLAPNSLLGNATIVHNGETRRELLQRSLRGEYLRV
jgi:hypothetical protein